MIREGYTITDLADFYDFTHNKWSDRSDNKITRIIPHHMAGNLTQNQYASIMHSERQMSATVSVYTDGTVVAWVPEEMRCWCSGSWDCDKNSLCLEIADEVNKGSNLLEYDTWGNILLQDGNVINPNKITADDIANEKLILKCGKTLKEGLLDDWRISDTAYNKAVAIMSRWCLQYDIDPVYTYRGAGINMHKDWASTWCPAGYMLVKILEGTLEKDIRREIDKIKNVPQIKAFVKSLYKTVLNREPEEKGLNYWVEELLQKEQTAQEVAYGFFTSNEYMNKKRNNTDFVIDLYNGILQRKPDKQGLKYWVSLLHYGEDREEIIKGFLSSKEFKDFAKKYNIEEG